MADIGSLWVRLGLKDAQYNKGLDKASKKTKGFAKVIKGLGPLIGGALAVGTVVRFGKEIFNLTAEFGSMMSRVQALTGANEDMTQTLRDQAKVLGKQTQFTATQAAEAMTFLAQAGLEVNQIYAAMPDALNLAAAGQISLAEAADISTNVMSAYGLAAEDLGRVNDIIINTTTNANTNVREFAEAFKMVGPIAKGAGQGIADVSAMIGLLGNAGIKGTMAGTALRTMMSKLIAPTGDAAKILERFAITTVTAEGKLRPMNDILIEMNKAGMNVADMFTVFDLRAAGAGSVLKDTSLTFEDFLVNVEKTGTAARIAAKQMDNLKGDSLELKSAWQGMMLEIGENSEGIFRGTIQFLTDMTNALGQMFGGENAKINKRIEDMAKSFGLLSEEEGVIEIEKMGKKVSSLNNEIESLNSSMEALKKKKGGLNEFIQAKQKVEDLGKELRIVEGILRKVSPKKVVPKPTGGGGGDDGGGGRDETGIDLLSEQLQQIEKEAAALDLVIDEITQPWEFGEVAASIADGYFPIVNEMVEKNDEVKRSFVSLQAASKVSFDSMIQNAKAWSEGIAESTARSGAGLREFGNEVRRAVKESIALYLSQAVAAMVTGALRDTALASGPFGFLIAPLAAAGAAAAANSAFDALIPSFATGIDNVPHDMLANIHEGEKIIPKSENRRGAGGRGGQLSVVVNGRDLKFILDEEERITGNSF